VVISARIEEELAQLPPEDAAVFLEEMGLHEAGLDRLIRAGYNLLGLQTYFTVGPKEARAWTIGKGTLAPQAAGVIHGDFEKGFIRAETVAYDDYVAGKGEAGAKEAGKFRVEGKTYEVQGRRRAAFPVQRLTPGRSGHPACGGCRPSRASADAAEHADNRWKQAYGPKNRRRVQRRWSHPCSPRASPRSAS
jgi:hypothetical protein